MPKSVKKTEEFCKLQKSCSRRCAGNPKETIDYHNNSRCLKSEEFSKRVHKKALYWNVKNPRETVDNYSRYPQCLEDWRILKKVVIKDFLNRIDFSTIKKCHYSMYPEPHF